MSDVVVTGMGVILAEGAGVPALCSALERGAPRLAEVDLEDGYHRAPGARRAAFAKHVDLSPWLSPRQARRMGWPSKFAVAAARMALDDAGVANDDPDADATAVAISTAFGPARFAEAIVKAVQLDGPETVSPFHFSESVANAAPGQVAIATRSRRANVAVTQRESGALQATILGTREVTLGRCRRALVGTSEEITPLVHALLDRFRSLPRPGDRGGETARPFDRDRSGFVAAEGATVLLLERANAAVERGAKTLAIVAAVGRGFDPSAPSWGWGDGAAKLAGTLRRTLARQGLSPGDIDLVVTGASGSRHGDRLEAQVLTEFFSPTAPPAIIAPKAAIGEYAGGQLAAALLAVQGRVFPTGGFVQPDPELGIVPWTGEPSLPAPKKVLVTALAAGGAAAWLVLERP